MEFGEVGRGNGMTTPAAEKVRGRKVVVRVRGIGREKNECLIQKRCVFLVFHALFITFNLTHLIVNLC